MNDFTGIFWQKNLKIFVVIVYYLYLLKSGSNMQSCMLYSPNRVTIMSFPQIFNILILLSILRYVILHM